MRLGGNRRWVPLIRGHTVSDFFSVKELFEGANYWRQIN